MKKEYLKQIFWDVEESNLNNLDKSQMVKRSISFGTLPIIQNMFSSFDRLSIKNIFLSMNPKTTTERRYNYFKKLLID